MGKVPAGICNFDEFKYMKKKQRKRGTRAGSISVYCAGEALANANINLETVDKSRIGVYVGITEHGNVQTEHEIHALYNDYDKNIAMWSHHHNPRTVANAPAGEVSLAFGITGPVYTLGGACAGGNLGIIHSVQMLQLHEVDIALGGGVSECPETFGIFAAFKNQNALGEHENPELSIRPLDKSRNGIAVSEGGALFVLERLDDALKRNAKIYGEVVGYHTNSDSTDFVLPNEERQAECMRKTVAHAGLTPEKIDLVNMHATGTPSGDIIEMKAVREVFNNSHTKVNATKGFIGHAMGAAGALELAGNIPSFFDHMIHPCKNIENLDPECHHEGLVIEKPLHQNVDTILNNSFGMLGINSTVIVKKYQA